jgi:hypothetical protein
MTENHDRPRKISMTKEDRERYSKLDTDGKIELLLSSFVEDTLAGVDEEEWSDTTLHKVTNEGFIPLITTYANFSLQKKMADENARLSKQNNRLQLFLAIFAGISAAAVIVQVLAVVH